MKPFLFLFIACLASALVPSQAQNAAAEAALERKANEERFKTLSANVANIQEAQEVLQQRISKLEKRLDSLAREIDKVKEDSAHANSRQVTREELKKVVEQLQEVDKNREADKKLILESIKDLAKLPVAAPKNSKPPVERAEAAETVDYTIRKGDRLGDILAAYNEEYAKQGMGRITLEQVRKVNPDLKPDKIREGQVIKIPVLPKK